MSNKFKTIVSVWMMLSIADSLYQHYDDGLDSEVGSLGISQQKLIERMSLYEDLASPKTVQNYVNELHKILDDIYFLDKLVQSGQISAEALDGYFSEYDEKLESIRQTLNNDELIAVLDNLQESLDSQDIRDDKLSEDIKSLQDRLKRQYDYTSELNTNLQQSIKKVQEDIDVVKKSKYGGKIWQK